ncbi:MAG: ClpXP protease specificity-enhancing factor [Gammaproteobacteria bacterium]|nr:ClpXP protease specificity-enhancing factor [Gammaproteobacteria bacterium]
MTSSRPYILRAIHQWIVDNGLTPHLLVNAVFPGVRVPAQYVENSKIILNISARAVSDYHQDNEWIMFQARFGGRGHEIVIPVPAVLAIYAKENGKGMVFGQEESGGEVPPPSSPQPPSGAPNKPGKPRLQVVK